jgi:hypothetical protein
MQHANEFLFPLVREPSSRWERAGLSPTQEKWLGRISTGLVVVFLAGWLYSIATRTLLPPPTDPVGTMTPVLGPASPSDASGDPNVPRSIGERITQNPLSPAADPLAPTITDALLRSRAARYAAELPRDVRGYSGKVYVQIVNPGEEPRLPAAATGEVAYRGGGRVAPAIPGAGIWNVVLRAGGLSAEVPRLAVIRTVPMSAKKGGRIGRYLIGSWPCEVGRCPSNPIYATPKGMVEITPQNKEMYLSEHIQLKFYITKLQEGIWPKYAVVDPQNLDKIELVVQELNEMGHPVRHLFAVSGFRSPWYNANGGSTAGRGQLSRHMYGDAMDIAVDNDRNGLMDDLNGDGRIDLKDARVIGEAVERVERKYPALVGGMHYYPPTGGHRGMVHIDTRGTRARW